MQLAYDADIISAGSIDRNDRFDRQLVFVTHVDQSRIDRAGGALPAVEIGNLGCQVRFDEGDQMIEGSGKPKSCTLDFR